MLADLCPDVSLDTSSTNHWMSYENLDLRAVYRRALDVVGAERLLFGSDSSFFPRGWNEEIFANKPPRSMNSASSGNKRPRSSTRIWKPSTLSDRKNPK